jgi:hypothetical protein
MWRRQRIFLPLFVANWGKSGNHEPSLKRDGWARPDRDVFRDGERSQPFDLSMAERRDSHSECDCGQLHHIPGYLRGQRSPIQGCSEQFRGQRHQQFSDALCEQPVLISFAQSVSIANAIRICGRGHLPQ